jgi:dTMP kinase
MTRNEIRKVGLHIGFTGIDGAGKSTQATLLCGWLTQRRIPNILREEKRDFVSEIATAIARNHGIGSGRKYLGEEYYMVALSFDLLREVLFDIKPFTAMGIIVVSTRTVFCRLAGGIARGCRSIELAKEIALFGGIPDLTIWLDVSPETACRRVMQRKFDYADLDHLKNYRKSLKELLQNYPHIRIDGEGTIESIQIKVRQVMEERLKQFTNY